MKTTYEVYTCFEISKELFTTTYDKEEAYVTAEEYVYGMGGTTQVIQKEDGKIVKVTQFESEGYIDEDIEVEIVETVLMELLP